MNITDNLVTHRRICNLIGYNVLNIEYNQRVYIIITRHEDRRQLPAIKHAGCDVKRHFKKEPTIIVKSVGKAVTFYLFFFPSSSPPRSISEQNFNVCVRNRSVIYPNIEWGGRGIFSKSENSLFLRIKMDHC